MSDRIAVMRDGRIEQIGAPEQIYRNPATVFVAGFIGDANMIEARVAAIDRDMLTLDVAGQSWRVPVARVTAETIPEAGASAVVVVRPEDMRIADHGGEGDLVLTARLEDRTFLGGRVRLALSGEDSIPLIVEARQQDVEQLAERVALRCAPADVAIVVDKGAMRR